MYTSEKSDSTAIHHLPLRVQVLFLYNHLMGAPLSPSFSSTLRTVVMGLDSFTLRQKPSMAQPELSSFSTTEVSPLILLLGVLSRQPKMTLPRQPAAQSQMCQRQSLLRHPPSPTWPPYSPSQLRCLLLLRHLRLLGKSVTIMHLSVVEATARFSDFDAGRNVLLGSRWKQHDVRQFAQWQDEE